jgi:UDP-N-acetylglucosamine acyltransferase
VIATGAIIHPEARLAEGVKIGAYSIIGAGVEIGKGTEIGPHTVITGPTRIGADNRIFQFCSIGADPQDKKYHGESESSLEIGSGNTIREFCTINRGTRDGGGVTRIADDNWIMAYVHIAHDCLVGSHCIFANHATLAGHVLIEDFVILGGFTGVHQFCRVGRHSFTAIASVVVKDIPPYLIVSGNVAQPSGLNREGLKRHQFPADTVKALRQAYKTVYREGLVLREALERLQPLAADCAEVAIFAEFISASGRGIAR